MHEILRNLPAGSRVLDLGCGKGSFRLDATAATVVRVDRDAAKDVVRFVRSDAAHLPFADHVFRAVISNHSLEHFDDLAGSLREIGRVTVGDGALFVAVPDASTLTDKIYRWLGKGGGHVNAFTSPGETAAYIEQATGLRHIATKTLCSSLSFLNRHNSPRPLPRRQLMLGAGYEWPLFLYVLLSRRLDRWINTRTSIYGWAFYFGNLEEPLDTVTWVNVCIRCGSGYSGCYLTGRDLIHRGVLRTYECPECGATNPFLEDHLESKLISPLMS